MALSLAITQTASWTTTTSPKTAVIAGATAGDYLFVLIGGDQNEPSTDVTAVTTTTTAGSTSAWTEPHEILTGGSADWISSAWATVSSTGSVTVSVARTGTGAEWGFYVVRATGCSGIGNIAFQDTAGSGKTVSLVVSGANSGVALIGYDWNALTVGTAWVPSANATLVQRAVGTNATWHAAYWTGQAAATTSYGWSGGTTSLNRILAIEMKEATAAAVSPPPDSRMGRLRPLLVR